ncbi:MAG: molybdopterin molybdotransferase MoeA [Gemmatimonadota bacterium]|nr:molybdopterin molybdotransferase MoeA [Gemmatimonadota bacterium]MDH3427477.1 molybdopterin molybdotransferase MoeA [Gemmatimonadota bacterium]
MTRPRSPDWLEGEEALDRILDLCPVLPEEELHLTADASDLCPERALAEDVFALLDHPPWDNSAMDGFAVMEVDVRGAKPEAPVVLPVSQHIPAGRFPESQLAPGTAARVMTGAPVPAGSTGVVRIEHTDGGRGESVRIDLATDATRNIRRRGEDLARGDVVALAGSALTPAVVGCLAMQGVERVKVRRRPRIAVLANGDELVDFEGVEDVRAGRKIMNSNSHALAAQLRAAGANPVDLGIAADTAASVRAALETARACDGVISTAGVSVGDHDHVKQALDESGFQRAFWRVRIRPGSPMTFGSLNGRPFWGLPGNPVSAMVTFEMFVRPALRKMAGHATIGRSRIRARAGHDISSPEDLTHLYRVRLSRAPDGSFDAALTGPQGSGILTSMVEAHGLAVLPTGVTTVRAGEPLEVILLRDLPS